MIYLILVFGLILRLIGLNQSLWLDEAIGALAVRDLSYREIFTSFLVVDNHPPLYYLYLKLWTTVFGYSEISLRMPSVIFGLGTIYITYLLGKKFFNSEKGGLVSAILLSTSQFHVYYSQEARMYCMAAFFAALAVYAFSHLFDDEIKRKYWLLFSSSTAVMVFTDYMPVFLLPVFFIYAIYKKMLFLRHSETPLNGGKNPTIKKDPSPSYSLGFRMTRENKHWWYKFILSFVPIILAGIIWFPIFQKQSAGGVWLMQTLPQWKNLAGGANVKQLLLVWMKFTLGRISLTDKTLYYLFSVTASVPFAILFANALKPYKKDSLLFLWLMLPLTVSFMVSIFFPAFIYFRLLFILPSIYLIMAMGVGNMKFGKILGGIIIVINLISCLIYYTDKFQKREMWREAVTYVENGIADNEIVVFSYPEPFAPYRWYEKKEYLSFGAADSIKADPILSTQKTNDLIKSKNGIYYFEYLNDLSDPTRIVMKVIVENGFTEKEVIGDFNGVGRIYYYVQ